MAPDRLSNQDPMEVVTLDKLLKLYLESLKRSEFLEKKEIWEKQCGMILGLK